MTTTDLAFAVAAALLGAAVGSFLNVVIYRLPRGEFFSAGRRSVCANPECRHPVSIYLNVPVLAWVMLGGRARCCGYQLSVRYPLVEALTAVLFLLLWAWPPVAPPLVSGALDTHGLLAFVFLAFFAANLVANSFIDVDHRILPDVLTKSGMIVGLVGSVVVPGLAGHLGVQGVGPAMDSLLYSSVGLVVGLGVTQFVRKFAELLFRREAMGFGDVKLMGAIGAFLGWEDVLLTFFVGCVLGAVVGLVHRMLTRDAYICFGPFLAGGALITLFAGEQITELVVSLQEWQRTSQVAPWTVSGFAVASMFLLVVLVRQGRKQ